MIRPPLEAGDPTEAWPDIRLPAATAAELIDAERGEALEPECRLRPRKPLACGCIESSALTAALLERDSNALESIRAQGRRVTSAVTIAEAARAVRRARASERLTADEERAAVGALRRFELRCYVVRVTDAVLARVRRPFPIEPIRTLDAVQSGDNGADRKAAAAGRGRDAGHSGSPKRRSARICG